MKEITAFVLLALTLVACATPPKNGHWEKKTAGGVVLQEVDFKDEKRNGHWIARNYLGEKEEEGEFKDGNPVGEWKTWPEAVLNAKSRPRDLLTPKLTLGVEFSVLGAEAFPSRAGCSVFTDIFNVLRLSSGIGFGGQDYIQSTSYSAKILPFGFIWEYMPYGTPVIGIGRATYSLSDRQFDVTGKGDITTYDIGYWTKANFLEWPVFYTLAIGVTGGLSKNTDPAFYVKLGYVLY